MCVYIIIRARDPKREVGKTRDTEESRNDRENGGKFAFSAIFTIIDRRHDNAIGVLLFLDWRPFLKYLNGTKKMVSNRFRAQSHQVF